MGAPATLNAEQLAELFDKLVDNLKIRNPFRSPEDDPQRALAVGRNVLEMQAIMIRDADARQDQAVRIIGSVAQQIMQGVVHHQPLDPEALVGNLVFAVIAGGTFKAPPEETPAPDELGTSNVVSLRGRVH